MKTIVGILFSIFSFSAYSQKYALIDRNFAKPILFTDSVTINQVSSNYFPVQVNDLDTLLANMQYLSTQLKYIQRSKFKSYNLRSGRTTMKITTVPQAYGDSYDILLFTSADNVNAEYLLANAKQLNKRAIKNLNSFVSFIKKDKDLVVREFKEYQPMVYDATVFISTKN